MPFLTLLINEFVPTKYNFLSLVSLAWCLMHCAVLYSLNFVPFSCWVVFCVRTFFIHSIYEGHLDCSQFLGTDTATSIDLMDSTYFEFKKWDWSTKLSENKGEINKISLVFSLKIWPGHQYFKMEKQAYTLLMEMDFQIVYNFIFHFLLQSMSLFSKRYSVSTICIALILKVMMMFSSK